MARIDVVELSPEMIALARRRTNNSDRINFHCGDAREQNWPAERYDAIVTNFFLDCFSEADARRLIRQLVNALRPERESGSSVNSQSRIRAGSGYTLKSGSGRCTDFSNSTTGLSATSLPPIEALMTERGMRRVAQEKQRGGLIVSEIWRHAEAAKVLY